VEAMAATQNNNKEKKKKRKNTEVVVLHGGRLEDEGKNIYPHGAILYQLILV
jgi:hypothetical protein